MPELIAPTVRLHAAWTRAHEEWGPGHHEDGFGLLPSDETASSEGFAAWVARLADASGGPAQDDQAQGDQAEGDPAVRAASDRARCTYRWIVEGDEVLGGIALRHGNGDRVPEFGHIGYGIRPSARRRGLATWALGRMLEEARGLGLDRVLLTCAVGNTASARTITRHGGVFEGIRETRFGAVRRYWIEV
ncbi:GNAT family N-acetyltransferase [Kitasatospora sp. RG8]|uniref:GNAT family N-acetyltransferase n=1 Tax=Kitasatospora sp. RG8 TaxID=2820815 RepID=UPI001AE04DDF|nr:GNAT family N-acetyltransferase [Kitasatospora sp. RG8]MBP0448760.1 GNAT family N-acetyltransferase [Kitasatospora sp. RG8]